MARRDGSRRQGDERPPFFVADAVDEGFDQLGVVRRKLFHMRFKAVRIAVNREGLSLPAR